MKEQKKCHACKSSKIGEGSLHDDWEGKLTCSSCKSRFDRWIRSENKMTKRLPTKQTYLLTGGSGVLGTELQKEDHTLGRNLDYWAPMRDELDIEDDMAYLFAQKHRNKIVKEINLCGIVHCAAYTNVPGAETPEGRLKAFRLNVLGTQNIKHLANALGVPMIYISTDYVYPGETGNYSEEDAVRPVNYYAITKLMGEVFMDPDIDLIIRTSFKPNTPWPFPKAFDDLYTSADYVDVIAEKISDCLMHIVYDGDGIFNIGTERKSIYDLARRRNTNVKPMSRKEITNVHLPSDISMNTDRFDEALERMVG